MNQHFIELDGHRYQVRVIQGQRQILFDGEWTPAFEFVDTLADRGEWDQVCELAKLGDNVLRKATAAPKPIGWKSIAWWPETVSLMSVENTSEDTHHSEEAARAVCGMLRRKGLGGDGKIFPLKTDVKPIFPENAKVEARD